MVLVAAAFIAGCGGEPTFDATNQKTMKVSSDKMAESVPDAKKREEFTMALASVFLSSHMKAKGDKKKLEEELKKNLHGKTADEIVARAKEIAAKMNKK